MTQTEIDIANYKQSKADRIAAELEELIRQGEQLERAGYPTGAMNQINRELLRIEMSK